MKVKMYQIIERIVEEGVESGWNRAHKHTDTPSEEAIKSCVWEYILHGFDEVFEFDQEE